MIKSESFISIPKAIEWCNRWNNKHLRIINIFADDITSYDRTSTYSHKYIVVYEEDNKYDKF